VEFRHDNGELSLVNINLAGMGIRRIRLAGLVPEVKEKTIHEALSPFHSKTGHGPHSYLRPEEGK